MNAKTERTMTDFTKETDQELSFKELFYDEVDVVEQMISEAENIQKVSEIQEQIDVKNNEMNSFVEKLYSKRNKFLAVSVLAFALFGVPGAILFNASLLITGAALYILLGIIPVSTLAKELNKERTLALTKLSKLRKQLAEATLGGKIVSNIEEIDEHWQNIYVQKDGKKQEYMIRLLKDNNGHDFVETKRIEMSNL